MTFIYFILILGITVFIHEFGHFICAKKAGVYVYEFSIGMGPRIFKWKRKNDETDYSIRILPIGGFVSMAGEEIEVDESVPKEKRLQSKSWGWRLLIMVAGVTFNFLLGLFLLFFVGLFGGVTKDATKISDSYVEGINNDDKIVAVNGHFVNNYDKLALELTVVGENDFALTVKDSEGKKKTVNIESFKIGKSGLLYGKDYGFSVIDDLIVDSSTNNEIEDGSKILKVNDVIVSNYDELLKQISLTDTIELVLEKDNQEKQVKINIKDKDDELIGYRYGFDLGGNKEKGVIPSFFYAFRKFFSIVEQMFFTIIYLISGKLSLKLLSGPVGIYNAIGISSSMGFVSLLYLLCLIDINVGFINLLPIPAFDGGHVLFLVIEKIKGSPVNQKVENMIHTVFLFLLMILMVFITYNDILNIFK